MGECYSSAVVSPYRPSPNHSSAPRETALSLSAVTESEPNTILGLQFAAINELLVQAKKSPGTEAEAVRGILRHLDSSNFAVRAKVLRCLKQLPASSIDELRLLLHEETSSRTAPALLCLGALEHCKDPNSRGSVFVVQRLLRRLVTEVGEDSLIKATREAALRSLSYIGTNEAVDVLLAQAERGPTPFRPQAVEALQLCDNLGVVSRHSDRVLDALSEMKLHPALKAQLASTFVAPQQAVLRPDQSHRLDAALECGLIDKALYSDLRAGKLLDKNLLCACLDQVGIVNEPLYTSLKDSRDAESLIATWGRRVSALARAVFTYDAWEQDSIPVPSLLPGPLGDIDRTLFFAALRSVDAGNLVDKRTVRPFDYNHQYQEASIFSGLSQVKFFRIELPAALAETRAILSNSAAEEKLIELLLPFAVQERLVNRLETRAEHICQNSDKFGSKWLTLGRILTLGPDGAPRVRDKFRAPLQKHPGGWTISRLDDDLKIPIDTWLAPFLSNQNNALWRFSFQDPVAEDLYAKFMSNPGMTQSLRQLSLGAQSTLRLQSFRSLRDDGDLTACQSEWDQKRQAFIAAENQRRAAGFQSIGFEAQDITTDRNLVQSWKAAFKRLGVDSPERPEFYSTLEAAFHPAFSPSVLSAGLAELLKLGFCADSRRGFMLHVSCFGSVGDEGKFIAAALMSQSSHFGRRVEDREHWQRAISKLFSKGFLYENRESIDPMTGEKSKLPRTEIRAVHVASSEGSREELTRRCRDVFEAVQVLTFAARCNSPDAPIEMPMREPIAALWRSYRARVTEIFKQGALESIPFLDQPWIHQGTGDPRDRKMVSNHPLVATFERLQVALSVDAALCGKVQNELQDTVREFTKRIGNYSPLLSIAS